LSSLPTLAREISMAERQMTIHFTDGSKLSFSFPGTDDGDPYSLSTRIQELLKGQYLLLEVDGSLMMFPFANIKYIQSYPAPSPVPANVLRGATLFVD
jgi:hypothetical protein